MGGSAAAIIQAVYDRQVAAKYPPPGRLVDIGGRKLHLIERGTGPSVVFEAGAGCVALDWTFVQTPLASVAHTVAYDRAGYGWSDPAPAPLSVRQSANDLHTLLHRAGIPPPYVLVGHSLGGLYVLSFAHQFPKEVAGLVLVDSSHPDMSRRMAEFLPDLSLLVTAGAPLGLQRLLAPRGPPHDYPAESWAARQAMSGRTQSGRANGRELHTMMTSGADSAFILTPFTRAIPLIVLTHSKPRPGLSPEKTRRWESEWTTMQRELAALSPVGTQCVVPDSSHMIPFDQPAAIVDAVNEILRTLPPGHAPPPPH